MAKIMKANKLLLLVLFFSIGIFGALINITRDGLWFDEACTALLMRCSFQELLDNLKYDAHPPLYFIGLKAVTLLFGESIFTMRMFSVAGLLFLSLLGVGPVKRLLGTNYGILFSLLCLYLPVSVSFAQEARMYTWICFLITGMILYGYFSIHSNQKRDWITFTAFSIGALYVHIYGLILFLTFTCIAFIWILLRHKTSLKPFLLCTAIVVISYTPWLQVTLSQAARAAENPWFVKTSIPQIVAPLLLLFTDRFLIINFISGFVLTALIAYYLFFRAVRFAKKNEEPFPVLVSGIIISTFLIAVIVSIFVAPILMPRYAFTVFGLFLITIIFGIRSIRSIKVRIFIGILLMLLFIPERIHVHANRINGPLPEIKAYLKNRTDSTQIFLHSNEHTFATFAWYFPDNTHYLYDPALNVAQRQSTGNGYRVKDWKPIIKNRDVVWVVNKVETHISKYVAGPPKIIKEIDNSLFGKSLESDIFKIVPTWYPGKKYSKFEMNPYWFQVQIARFDKKK